MLTFTRFWASRKLPGPDSVKKVRFWARFRQKVRFWARFQALQASRQASRPDSVRSATFVTFGRFRQKRHFCHFCPIPGFPGFLGFPGLSFHLVKRRRGRHRQPGDQPAQRTAADRLTGVSWMDLAVPDSRGCCSGVPGLVYCTLATLPCIHPPRLPCLVYPAVHGRCRTHCWSHGVHRPGCLGCRSGSATALGPGLLGGIIYLRPL